ARLIFAVLGMEDRISDVEEVKLLEDVKDKMEDGVVEPPDWLPDGWIMEVRRGDDGALYRYYISPVSGAKFRMKSEVLNYLFSEIDEHFIEAKESVARSMLVRSHEWLPKGWLIEIRAGGQNMDKMYKFYVYSALGVRVFCKEDVLLYVKEMKIANCDTNGQCDTNSRDNILAEVEFNPFGLPHGWVKEIVYRKTSEGIRKDPYYTDPVNQYVFRTLTSAVRYLETGKVTKRAFFARTSVHELYNFEKSADLHECLRKRLTKNVMTDTTHATPSRPRRSKSVEKINLNEKKLWLYEDSNTSTDLDSPDENQEIRKRSLKAKGKEAYSSKTIRRPRGRPSKVAKETDGDISAEKE
uniref:MBD domain-containing protein n=1 Tax=Aegilops tauschii subsp. strangulata TaxID=200361 RepID=A0A453T2P4_AEGTS